MMLVMIIISSGSSITIVFTTMITMV